MYKLKLLIFICFISTYAFSQQYDVNGVIKIKQSQETLPYTQIVLEGTSIGTISDANGIFILRNISAGNYKLRVMYTGYKTEYLTLNIKDRNLDDIEIYLTQTPILIEEIHVSGTDPLALAYDAYSVGEYANSPNDVGEYFRNIVGANAVKKGGFALDPVIRGFKQEQLIVQIDGGSKCWGGCPNRMDPPTSHIQSDDLENIEVIKGPFSVRWGQTLGGIVNLVMKRPAINNDFQLNGTLSGGYESNGNNRKERVTLNGGAEKWDFYLSGGEKVFGNYISGGDHIEIPSSFTMRDYTLKLGINPTHNHRFQVSWRQSFASDVSYPALPMDASKDDTNILTIDYSGRNLTKFISSIAIKAYYSDVLHIMDNFDRKNFAMVEAEMIADATTYGGRFEIGSQISNGTKIFIGNDYYLHPKDGIRTRFVKTNPCNTNMHPNKIFVDNIWQNSSYSDYGIFGEYNQILSDKLTINTGVRIDLIDAQIGEPSDQFIIAYGLKTDYNEFNTSYMGILKYSPSPLLNSTLSIGRGMRSPDLTERFINHLPVGKSGHEHFGNPNLKPEVNNQIELAVQIQLSDQLLSVNAFYSGLSNYILAQVDSTMDRLYLPCSNPKYTKVFHNIENAYQLGSEFQVSGSINNLLSYYASIAFLLGHNVDIDEPLPEMSPLTTNLSLKYAFNNIPAWLELSGRSVFAQTRVSNSYGETETDGYSLLNVAAGYSIKNIRLRLDIENLFDTEYFDHLSRSFAKNSVESGLPFYEQGRNIKLSVDIII